MPKFVNLADVLFDQPQLLAEYMNIEQPYSFAKESRVKFKC